MTTSPTSANPAEANAAVPLDGTMRPGVDYAFSDRTDGTMSSSVGEGDHRRARAALVRRMGLGPDSVSWMDQVHGADVEVVGEAEPGARRPSCDGIVGTAVGRGVAVLVADCVPVLMASAVGIAAAHSGRPGLVAGIAPATARRLCAQTGTVAADLDVVIGPAVGPCCYEVPRPMAEAVERAVPGTRALTTWGTDSVDLVAGVVHQLAAIGVQRIVRAGSCTLCSGEGRWFSHRATGGAEGRPAGRQAGIVVRRAPGARA